MIRKISDLTQLPHTGVDIVLDKLNFMFIASHFSKIDIKFLKPK